MILTWSALQKIYVSDPTEHLARARALGLDCPFDAFEQLFHDHHADGELAGIVRFVDWSEVEWEQVQLSGVALRHASVPRPYQRAVNEARWRTAQDGFYDERPEVMGHWDEAHTWIRAPIALTGDVLPSALRYEFVIGFTRLGNLLGALDRRDVREFATHRVWIAQRR